MTLDEIIDRLSAHIETAMSEKTGAPYIFGVSGGQGAGKSTLCAGLQDRLREAGRSCVTLGLDDYYLSQTERQDLAQRISPLCAVRGVPGTHDIALMRDTIDRLCTAPPDRQTMLRLFSKSHDNPLPQADWPPFTGRPEVILIEGWCVGGRAAFLADAPPLAWEQANDPDMIWKNWTLQAAPPYEAIWDLCDDMLLLRHTDFDAVIDSRWQQEQGNAAASGVWQFQSRDEVAAFCAHYQSWTEAIWRHLPARVGFSYRRNGDRYVTVD